MQKKFFYIIRLVLVAALALAYLPFGLESKADAKPDQNIESQQTVLSVVQPKQNAAVNLAVSPADSCLQPQGTSVTQMLSQWCGDISVVTSQNSSQQIVAVVQSTASQSTVQVAQYDRALQSQPENYHGDRSFALDSVVVTPGFDSVRKVAFSKKQSDLIDFSTTVLPRLQSNTLPKLASVIFLC